MCSPTLALTGASLALGTLSDLNNQARADHAHQASIAQARRQALHQARLDSLNNQRALEANQAEQARRERNLRTLPRASQEAARARGQANARRSGLQLAGTVLENQETEAAHAAGLASLRAREEVDSYFSRARQQTGQAASQAEAALGTSRLQRNAREGQQSARSSAGLNLRLARRGLDAARATAGALNWR